MTFQARIGDPFNQIHNSFANYGVAFNFATGAMLNRVGPTNSISYSNMGTVRYLNSGATAP